MCSLQPLPGPSFILHSPFSRPDPACSSEPSFVSASSADKQPPLLPSIAELFASVGPSHAAPKPTSPPMFDGPSSSSFFAGHEDSILPQIPPGYEAPRVPTPRKSTSSDAVGEPASNSHSSQKAMRELRDHGDGDLATAMILMGIQAKSDPAFPFRKKRQRSSPAQLNVLEEHFLINPMPSHISRVELALRLNMTPRRVQVWFQNKRAKVRRAIRNGEEVNVCLPDSDTDD